MKGAAMLRLEDQKAVRDEISLIVREARRDGQPVRPVGLARIVGSTYPNSGLSISEIADRIDEAAHAAGIPVYEGTTLRRPVLAAA
jgi:hypothetical protein